MKNLFFVSIVAVLALLGFTAQAQTVQSPQPSFLSPNYVQAITVPATLTHNSLSNLTGQTFIIYPGHSVTLTACYTNVSTTATTNLAFQLSLSPDGVSYPTIVPLTLQLSTIANVTNISTTNIPAAVFDGYARGQVVAVTNGDNVNAVWFVPGLTNGASVLIGRQRIDLRP